MITNHRWAHFAILIFIVTASALSGNPTSTDPRRPSSVVEARNALDDLRSQTLLARQQLASVLDEIKITQRRMESGTAESGDLSPLKLKQAEAEQKLRLLERDMSDVQRLVNLSKPVSVALKSVNIRQAVDALSREAGMSISLEDNVPQGILVNTDAQNVPLGAVLEVIADAAHLVIAPSDAGIALRQQGKLVVDGKSIALADSNAPWSDEWGAACAADKCALGQRWLRLFSATAYSTAQSAEKQGTE